MMVGDIGVIWGGQGVKHAPHYFFGLRIDFLLQKIGVRVRERVYVY